MIRRLGNRSWLSPPPRMHAAATLRHPSPPPNFRPPQPAQPVQHPPCAVIGVGQMGAAVASNLVRHGVQVTLYDHAGDANVPGPLAGALSGAAWAATAAEAAERSKVVFTCLPRPENVTSSFQGSDGILQGLKRGSTWVEHSTTDFENTLKIKDQVQALGCRTVEAPLTGGMQILREGKMACLVGSDDFAHFESEIASLVALSAPRIVRCGAFGHATIIKLYSNMLCAAIDCAMGEALCTAKKAGLDLKLVFDAMRISSGNSFCWETEAPLVLSGSYDPNFTAKMMLKDINLGLELGKRYGVPHPFYSSIAATYEQAIQAYGEDSGSTIPVRLTEDAAGVRLAVPAADANEGGEDAGEVNGNAAFKSWSYTTEILPHGSFAVVHRGYDNPFLKSPFLDHLDSRVQADN